MEASIALGKRTHSQRNQSAHKFEGSAWLKDPTKNYNQVTIHESTKLTSSEILNSQSKRMRVA